MRLKTIIAIVCIPVISLVAWVVGFLIFSAAAQVMAAPGQAFCLGDMGLAGALFAYVALFRSPGKHSTGGTGWHPFGLRRGDTDEGYEYNGGVTFENIQNPPEGR